MEGFCFFRFDAVFLTLLSPFYISGGTIGFVTEFLFCEIICAHRSPWDHEYRRIDKIGSFPLFGLLVFR